MTKPKVRVGKKNVELISTMEGLGFMNSIPCKEREHKFVWIGSASSENSKRVLRRCVRCGEFEWGF